MATDPTNRSTTNDGRETPPRDRTARTLTVRAVSSAALIITACLLAPVSVLSVWVGSVVSQTERYVETVAPIAADPIVQAAVADEVTAAILENLRIEEVTSQALEALARQEDMPARAADALPALAVPLARGIEDFTRSQARALIADERFESVWAQANRAGHARLVALLEGEESGAITAEQNRIVLDLAPVTEAVSARLVDEGFGVAANLPPVQRTLVLVESESIGQAQRFYRVLTAAGVWLPVLAVTLLAAGILLARDRRRALLTGALGVATATAGFGAGLTLVSALYLDTSTLTAQGAANVFDILVRFLRTGLRATAVVALLVALAAFLAGPSSAAVRTRSVVARGLSHHGADGNGAAGRVDAFNRWVARHRVRLWAATLAAAGVTLTFWNRPTVAGLLVVALVVTLVVVLIAVLGSSAGRSAGPSSGEGEPAERTA